MSLFRSWITNSVTIKFSESCCLCLLLHTVLYFCPVPPPVSIVTNILHSVANLASVVQGAAMRLHVATHFSWFLFLCAYI